jgi:hypothetical protein
MHLSLLIAILFSYCSTLDVCFMGISERSCHESLITTKEPNLGTCRVSTLQLLIQYFEIQVPCTVAGVDIVLVI